MNAIDKSFQTCGLMGSLGSNPYDNLEGRPLLSSY